jgi:hypothetical protein
MPLACAIVSSATGLALAFLVMHVLMIRLNLGLATRFLANTETKKQFKERFDEIRDRLSRDPLIGRAWDDFERACIRPREGSNTPIYSTVKPEIILNAGIARERLFGLKLLPSIPGYFVGLGLLLTFIGLVIALSVAASGASGDPGEMTGSLKKMLEAATFKFSTSIAGLFSSIALSLIFRTYAIAIENGFNQLCVRIQAAITYWPPPMIAYRSLSAQHDQLHELKQINDVQFFRRIGRGCAGADDCSCKRHRAAGDEAGRHGRTDK